MLPIVEQPSTHRTLHLVYSFACNLRCSHCIYHCGPDVHQTMGIARAKAFIQQAGFADIRKIVFTGGEPFLRYEAIRTLIRQATKQGIQSAVITNASWATSRSRAREYLSDLRQNGLRSITLSTDRYHLLAVPLQKLENVLSVAKELGLQAGVKISHLAHDPVAHGLYRSLRSYSNRIRLQEISPLGRGSLLRWAVSIRSASSFSRPGCLTPPVLLPNGDLLTCCNLPARDMGQQDYPFILGNVEKDSLCLLLNKRSEDPILAALRNNGPSPLLMLLSISEPRFRLQSRVLYHNGCDLCFHLFRKLPNKDILYSFLPFLGMGGPKTRLPTKTRFALLAGALPHPAPCRRQGE